MRDVVYLRMKRISLVAISFTLPTGLIPRRLPTTSESHMHSSQAYFKFDPRCVVRISM